MISAKDTIDGAAKALRLLEAFSPERQRLNATLAAERAQLSRAAARRHLLTLAHLGYLESDADGYYWLTPRVLRFAGIYLASARLPRLVQPALNRLALQTGLTFSVAVAADEALGAQTSAVAIIARSAQPALDRATAMAHGLHLGARPALHTTSTGRILLAQLSPAALRLWLDANAQPGALARMTAHTLTTAHSLRQAISAARTLDAAFVREENELGVQALAIPLRNASGRCTAALNVVASTAAVERETLSNEVLPLMRAEAQSLAPLL